MGDSLKIFLAVLFEDAFGEEFLEFEGRPNVCTDVRFSEFKRPTLNVFRKSINLDLDLNFELFEVRKIRCQLITVVS